MRNVRNRGFKHCENTGQSSVLVCVSREVRDFIEVWIVNEHPGLTATSPRPTACPCTCLIQSLRHPVFLTRSRSEPPSVLRRHLRPVTAFHPKSSMSCHSSATHALCLLQSVLRADLVRKPNFSLLVRRCACPALPGRKSTARLWAEKRCRSGCTGTVEMGET